MGVFFSGQALGPPNLALIYANLFDGRRVKRSSLSRGGRENRLRTIASDRPARFDWSGLREGGQSRPRRAADEDPTDVRRRPPAKERDGTPIGAIARTT